MGKKNDKSSIAPESEVEMNMTPMIDIVFQMILFFIIITDFTQKEIALLELPWSTVGTEDEGDDPERLIINVTAPVPSSAATDPKIANKWPASKRRQADKILVKNKELTFVDLYHFLQNSGVKNLKYRDPENEKLCSRKLLIRCDGDQSFDYVKAILQICAMPDVAIYKIEIATAEEVKKKEP